MYPFSVLKLPHNVTDQEVSDRYHELIRLYPPDKFPDEFAQIRKAYESIKDRQGRLRTRLFYLDTSRSSFENVKTIKIAQGQRVRVSPDKLESLLASIAQNK